MKRKLLLSVFLMLSLIVFASGSIFALPVPSDGEKYQYIESISTTLSISSGTANAGVRVRDTDGDTTKIACSMYLQKKVSGNWDNVKKWTKTTYSGTLTMSKTKTVSKGTYRVKCVTKAYKGTNYETITTYSVTKTY